MYMLPFLANSFSNLQMNNHLTSEIKGKSGGGSYFCGEKRRNFSLVCFLLAFFTILSVNAGRSGYFLSLLAPEATKRRSWSQNPSSKVLRWKQNFRFGLVWVGLAV